MSLIYGSHKITHRIILKRCDVSLNRLLHIASSNKCGCQVDVAVDEVGLQANSMPIVLQRLLKLTTFLVNIAQVAKSSKKIGMISYELANGLVQK